MPKTVHTKAYKALIERLVAARKSAGMTQETLAKRLRRPQSYVAKVEARERRLDVIELLQICKVIAADPIDLIQEIEALV